MNPTTEPHPVRRWESCLNPATVSGLDLRQVITLAASAGIDAIEVSIQQVLALGPARTRALLERHGVKVAAAAGILPDGPVLPAPLLTNDPEAVQGIAERFAAMAIIGCPVATVLLNPSTDMPYGLALTLAARRLRMLADYAQEYGVYLAVEAVGAPCGHKPPLSGPHPFVTSLPQLAELLEKTDTPHLGACVDSFHWAATGADPTHITHLGHAIAHVQIADAPHQVPAEKWADSMRLFPGDGALDWKVFTAALEGASYTGALSVELFNPRLRTLPETQIADRAAAATWRLSVAVPE